MRAFLIALALALALPLPAFAGGAWTWEWPSTTAAHACSGTLQACIDGTLAGDTVLIVDWASLPDGYTAIDEDISIPRGITLTAAAGVDAVFAPQRRITATLGGSGPHQLTISHLVLREGWIDIDHVASADGGSVRIEHNRMLLGSPPSEPCVIRVKQTSGNVTQVVIGDNVLTPAGSGSPSGPTAGICVAPGPFASATDTQIYRNRIETAAAAPICWPITASTSGGSLRIAHNVVLGAAGCSGITATTTGAFPASVTASVRIDHNVVVGTSNAVGIALGLGALAGGPLTVAHNTVTLGRIGIEVSLPGSMPGRVANNIIAFQHEAGLSLLGAPSASNDYNLIHAAPGGLFTPGANTRSGDPNFESIGHPRPRWPSPAIDQGNAADLPGGVWFDADGEARSCGPVDVGAYEYCGDSAAQVTADGSNAVLNWVELSPYPVALASDALLLATEHANGASASSLPNLGVWYTGTIWAVFNQNQATMATLQAFSVIAPVQGKTAFSRVSDFAAGGSFLLDDWRINGLSAHALVVMARYTDSYHDHPVAAVYSSAGGGRWHIRNEDSAAMPAGITFNVMAPRLLSPNSARIPARQRLRHPLLDDNPCAAPVAGRFDDLADGVHANPSPYGVQLSLSTGPGAPRRWQIESAATAGALFNVVIDGDQANGCRAPTFNALFRDGFE
ncbi:MAG: hypothetical protein HYV17_09515 [Xanthomonadales bacterium]|nr:hypothetical protein [Xanthomonadales bacterium]